ncbi:hypothetical protein OU995_21175 [Roseateles sp. SL47]|uniref:hypothetical protein n=1 Tax=Roseateles sp. SL47 TaxID=2995138 RepID=UPI002270CD06|nr:hypothetical protein [Roseateles sp. SL47]WAC72058.1 hypothetical protein OU995_21175 [Roseateles sp. SL47]
MWHAEVSELILREVVSADDPQNHIPFGAVATVNLLSHGRAFIRAALRRDGRSLSARDFRDIARKLRDEHDVQVIEYDRKGELRSWPTWRA